jgi:hypothetical protein
VRSVPTRVWLGVAGVLVLVVPIVAAVVLRGGSGAPSAAATLPAPAPAAAPPGRPALVLGAGAGPYAVGIAAKSSGNGVAVRVTVLAPTGDLASKLQVAIAVDSSAGAARPCGGGCYERSVPLQGSPRTIAITVAPGATARFVVPALWPPRPAGELLKRASTAFLTLRSLAVRDSLRSDATHGVLTHWRFVAPNRLSYDIEGGPKAVVIGGRRWDRNPGGHWVRSPEDPPISVPVPPWSRSAADATLVATGTRNGRPTATIAFFDPGSIPAWFLLELDRATGRPLELHMTSAAHFMHDVYGSFDRPLSIVAPK